MDQKPITIILGDLHIGGGKADPSDDHIYQESEFVKFLAGEIPESRHGKVELFINGDGFEFAQVKPDVYSLASTKYWCSEDESIKKLNAMLDGHKDIFNALRDFKERGNQITIAAGNHDVDLWWDGVQKKIEEQIGEVEFALGQEWYPRYDGALLVGHGHMMDPANRFKRWDKPILPVPDGPPRLEMCPGTLFMVKFVNWLENQYPFADNVKPVTALSRLLYAEDRGSFKAAVWTLLRFVGNHPLRSLAKGAGASKSELKIGKQFLFEIDLNDTFANGIVDLYREMGELDATLEGVRKSLRTEDDVFRFLAEVIVKLDPDRWQPLFDLLREGLTLRVKNGATTLSIIRAGFAKEKEELREEAINQLSISSGRKVVVCGHTHQPDEWRPTGKADGGYFNPGSWTRYVDLSKCPKLTLEDLKVEEDFPYRLGYIRVEYSRRGHLRADSICYKYGDAKWS